MISRSTAITDLIVEKRVISAVFTVQCILSYCSWYSASCVMNTWNISLFSAQWNRRENWLILIAVVGGVCSVWVGLEQSVTRCEHAGVSSGAGWRPWHRVRCAVTPPASLRLSDVAKSTSSTSSSVAWRCSTSSLATLVTSAPARVTSMTNARWRWRPPTLPASAATSSWRPHASPAGGAASSWRSNSSVTTSWSRRHLSDLNSHCSMCSVVRDVRFLLFFVGI